jgi:hypothetical protein
LSDNATVQITQPGQSQVQSQDQGQGQGGQRQGQGQGQKRPAASDNSGNTANSPSVTAKGGSQ